MAASMHTMRCSLGFLLFCATSVLAFLPHKRFEYKYSFKGPHLVQKDGTVPFWEHGGHAIASDESVRITPSLRSKKGYIFSKEKAKFSHFEIEVVFRVSGRGRVGADGLAVWFTEERGVDGPVFGGADKWKGLGVFFDSFDNDAQHNNPYIMAMVNDGTKEYDHNSDGSTQHLGGCLKDFRNRPFGVRAKIEYYQKSLSLFVNLGLTGNKDDFELCMRADNVELPEEGYFGVTAATGGLADDHDVTAFLTHSLTPIDDSQSTKPGVSEEERQKYEKEFDEYWRKLQEAKSEYQKEHPDQVRRDDFEDENKWFESQDERQLKNIYEGQNQIHLTVRDMHRKLDEIIGRQERVLAQVGMITQGGQINQGQGQAGGQGQVYIDTIKRHEVDMVLNNQRDLVQSIRDMRTIINDIQGKTATIQASSGQQGGGGYDIVDLKNHLNNLQDDVRTIINRPQQGSQVPNCPPQKEPNCVTPMYFFLVMGAQIALFIGYFMYKSSKEASAKKFY